MTILPLRWAVPGAAAVTVAGVAVIIGDILPAVLAAITICVIAEAVISERSRDRRISNLAATLAIQDAQLARLRRPGGQG